MAFDGPHLPFCLQPDAPARVDEWLADLRAALLAADSVEVAVSPARLLEGLFPQEEYVVTITFRRTAPGEAPT